MNDRSSDVTRQEEAPWDRRATEPHDDGGSSNGSDRIPVVQPIVGWHETTQKNPAKLLCQWGGKPGPSFGDVLGILCKEKLENTRANLFEPRDIPPGVNKFLMYLKFLLPLAA